MKKWFLLVCVLLGLMAGTACAYNPYAPNQFDTMERNSWEFKTVYSLSQAGLTGADMHKFDKSYALTRYEMTQMVAAAMKHRSAGTTEQRQQIDKLAETFSEDLKYLDTESASVEQRESSGTTQATMGEIFNWK